MLSKAQIRLIRSLHTKHGREKSGFCLVEGENNVTAAAGAIEFQFRRNETEGFNKLVTTKTPQGVAAVARIPRFRPEDIAHASTIVVLDEIQDPGNVGAILRLCQGFRASLVLIESADPSSPKVLRSSSGAFFHVPWVEIPREQAPDLLASLKRPIFRLERRPSAQDISIITKTDQIILIAGNEGRGIRLPVEGTSVVIPHDPQLESLNVAQALGIALFLRYESQRGTQYVRTTGWRG